jgi:formate hydrogenlyase subunit 6/NADH:ubiquinone oxidoreductase subunit I
MKTPKLRELVYAIRSLVSRPYTLAFPAAPSVPPATSRGQMKWDELVCVGCGACARVCPTGAIEVEDSGPAALRKLVRRYGMCIFCGQCHALCTTKTGCNHSTDYDLACLDRNASIEKVEKELVLCECCGEAVATREHLRWIYERLGSLAYACPTVFLSFRREGETALPLGRPPVRADRMKVLCPRCKRDVVLSDRA